MLVEYSTALGSLKSGRVLRVKQLSLLTEIQSSSLHRKYEILQVFYLREFEAKYLSTSTGGQETLGMCVGFLILENCGSNQRRGWVTQSSSGLQRRTKVHEFSRSATVEKKRSSHPK